MLAKKIEKLDSLLEVKLSELTNEELLFLIEKCKGEIKRRKASTTITLSTVANYDSRKHGKPYVAFLTYDAQGKMQRRFVDATNTIYSSNKKYLQREFVFEASDGAIIEARLNDGSWKNEKREYFVIEDDEAKAISKEEAFEILKKMK